MTTASARAASYVLTLEEIGHLAAEGGKPAETLMNVVALIASRFQTDVCSAYLLEPDRANLVLAATLGLRPAVHRHAAHGAATKVWPVWWPSRCGRSPWNRSPIIRASSISARRARRLTSRFCGVPLIDRGVLQGVLVVQTIEPRAFTDDEMQMLAEAAAQVAPVVSEARTLDRFIAPAQERLWSLARNLWWSWDNDSTSLFRDLDPVRWRQLNHNPISLLSEIPLAKLERRAGELVLHGRINYAYRRQQEYLQADRTWGATHAGVSAAPAGGLFLGRVRPARVPPDLFRRLGRSGRRSHQERFRSGHSAGRHRVVLRPGLFPPAAGSRRLAAGRILQTDVNQLPMEPAIGKNGEPVKVQIETRSGVIRAKVWRVKVGRCDLLLLDSNVEGNAPEDRELTSRLYGGDGRVRIRQELLLGVGGFRALKAMGITPGVLHLNEGHSGFAVLEAIANRMEEEGLDLRPGRAARVPRSGVSPPTLPCPPATTASTPG